jgi:hypothetical protein
MPARAAIVAITGRSVGDPGMEPNKKYINTLYSKYEVGKKNYLEETWGWGSLVRLCTQNTR